MAGAAIGALVGWGVGGTVTAAAIGFSIGRAYDNYKEQKEMAESLNQSPTYSFGPIRNTKSHEMPIPIIYGENLVAGNIINQKIRGENDRYMDLQVGISEGPIESITEIKANENLISPEIHLGERNQSAWSNNSHGQTFPYVAHYNTTLDAEKLELSSTPTLTAIVKGLKIRVWDGNKFVIEYSNNPPWCLLDFLTNKRYGLGIEDGEIDLETFKEAATYSDELVSGEKRFELDMVIDAKKSALDIITEMLSTFRGFLFYSDGKLKLKVDRPEAAVQTFEFHDDKEKDNINEGSFSYSKTSRKERLKEVTVQYTEPDENYERISARFTDESFSAKAKQTITLIGVNRFSQAGRMARYFQKKSKYCTTQATWSAGIGDIQAEVGDVVLVSHVVPEWIDKPFRIVQIEEKENDEMQITAIEYNEAIYSDDGVVYQPSTGSKLPNPFEPPANVINLSLLEQANVLEDGSWIPQIKVTFDQPSSMFWKYANIYYSDNNGATWEFHEKTELTQSIIKELPPGTFKVRVQSENNRGVKEDFGLSTTGQITVNGKDAPPSNVNWGNCSFQSQIELNWQPVTDIDLKAYEVRTDQNFGNDDNALIYRGNGLKTIVNSPTRRQYTFYLKALDRSGNYSNTADEITLVNSAPSAPNFTGDDITEFFSAIKIHIPEVSDANGYRVYITPSDGEGNSTGQTVVNQFSAAQDYYYPVNSGDSVLIKIGTYDSLTQIMDDENISAEIEAIAANLDDIAQFAADLRPPKIVNALPVLPDQNYPVDSSVVYDGKLYINEAGSWVSKVQEAETAVNALIAGTVEAGAIGADELASAEAIIQKLGANQLIAYESQIKDAIIDDAKIASVEADKITTNRAKITSAQIEKLNADRITIGANSSFENNYDPSEKETPIGAQEKANNAEDNAKSYANPTKPEKAHLWHFDRSLISTDGIKPLGVPVATLRPNEGRFGGAVAVEEGTTNLVFDSGTTFLGSVIDSSQLPTQPPVTPKWCYTWTNLQWNGDIELAQTFNTGDYLTISGWVYESGDWCNLKYFDNGSSFNGINLFSSTGNIGWHYFEKTLQITSDGITSCRIEDEGYDYNRTDGTETESQIWLCNVQIEQKTFATSFIDGSRENGELVYNHDALSTATLNFWSKVIPSDANDIAVWYNIIDWQFDNGSRIWIEKDPSNNISIYGTKEIPWDNKWHMYTITYNNGEMCGFIDGEKGSSMSFSGNLKKLFVGTGINNTEIVNALFDELLISSKAHTDQQIKDWYNSQAPFYDAEPVRSAGSIEMWPGGMRIEGPDGIELIGPDGDKAVLNDDLIAFYKAGSSKPHWYSKNVAYGTAQSGDYIELNWDKKPKVQTAIKGLSSYNPDYSENKQSYDCFPNGITPNGFYVIGRNITTGGDKRQFSTQSFSDSDGPSPDASLKTFSGTFTTSYTPRDSITDLGCRFRIKLKDREEDRRGTYLDGELKIYYKPIDGEKALYNTYIIDRRRYEDYNKIVWDEDIHIPDLPKNQYLIEAQYSIEFGYEKDVYIYAYFDNFYSWGNLVVDNGEVMWIAVEGGAE